MRIRCNYCNSYISDTDIVCSNCGATNENLKRVGNEVPTTIEELKKWYSDHNLPDEEITRFFIGKDIKEAKAYGIYQDPFNLNFIVYKNKADGSRFIRYEGTDEVYAVNEIYLKLKEEILIQKSRNNIFNEESKNNVNIFESKFNVIMFVIRFILVFLLAPLMTYMGTAGIFVYMTAFLTVNPGIFIILFLAFIIKNNKIVNKLVAFWNVASIVLVVLVFFIPGIIYNVNHKTDAYYISDNQVEYYNYGGDWYYYDTDTSSWKTSDEPDNITYSGKEYNEDYGSNFENSSYYSTYYSYSNDTSSNSSTSTDNLDSSNNWSSSDSWSSSDTD